MFEHRGQPPISRRAFALRLMRHGGIAAIVLAFSLFVGMIGYHGFEKLSWLDGFLNSAMLLGGMGPVDPLKTVGGKLFAGFYALYSGLIFITVASLIGAPLFHRLIHRFHWEEEEKVAGKAAQPAKRRPESGKRPGRGTSRPSQQ